MTAPQPHRREFSRVQVALRADLAVGGVPLPGATVLNLSLNGVLLAARPARPVEAGDACDIRLHLDGTEVEVHALGRVVRVTGDGFAVEFTEIVGLESLDHLRNLILYNSHSPDAVEHEFHAHLGLKPDR